MNPRYRLSPNTLKTPASLEHPSILTSITTSSHLDKAKKSSPFFAPPENPDTIRSVKDVPLSLIFKMKDMFSEKSQDIIAGKITNAETIHDLFNLTSQEYWPENAASKYELSDDEAVILKDETKRVYEHLSKLIL